MLLLISAVTCSAFVRTVPDEEALDPVDVLTDGEDDCNNEFSH